jgi:hypothetical protein
MTSLDACATRRAEVPAAANDLDPADLGLTLKQISDDGFVITDLKIRLTHRCKNQGSFFVIPSAFGY